MKTCSVYHWNQKRNKTQRINETITVETFIRVSVNLYFIREPCLFV